MIAYPTAASSNRVLRQAFLPIALFWMLLALANQHAVQGFMMMPQKQKTFSQTRMIPPPATVTTNKYPQAIVALKAAQGEGEETKDNHNSSSDSEATENKTKMSLEEKMKSWEASEEELKAASLGGQIPQKQNRADGFDVGLYIAFPIMIVACLLFLAFPFVVGNLNVDSVGPPPTS